MRFEMDMVAHSLCEFGGGEAEREELRAYRAIHFAMLSRLEQSGKLEDASRLRENGHCPLMPEEAVLMLVALGFNRGTHLYLAGAHMYGGQSRMSALTNLYPYLATKEDLLTPAELAPFINRSSQVCFLQTLLTYCYPMCMSLGKNKLLKHFVGAISLHQFTPSFSFMLSACSTFNEAGRTIQ
jgi:hypothetical protein